MKLLLQTIQGAIGFVLFLGVAEALFVLLPAWVLA
jgi:hypothetical protein